MFRIRNGVDTKMNWAKILLGIAIVLNVVDLFTARRILAGEANPIFLLTHSYWVMIVMKIVVIGLILLAYLAINGRLFNKNRASKIPNPFTLFVYMTYIVFFIVGLSFGIYSNISASDEQMIQVQEYKDGLDDLQMAELELDTMKAYFKVVGILMLFPTIMSLLVFLLWKSSFISLGGIVK